MIAINVFCNLLAAELDRSGGYYARLLVRIAVWMLPIDERERRLEEFLSDIEESAARDERPLFTAWRIALVGAPGLAWDAWRRGPVNDSDSDRETFAELISYVTGNGPQQGTAVVDPYMLESVFAFVCAVRTRRAFSLPVATGMTSSIRVAQICATASGDTATLCAALLRDVIAANDVTIADVRRRFGSDVAKLAAADSAYSSPPFRRGEDLRSHLRSSLAVTRDRRVVVIRIAERLAWLREVGRPCPAHDRDSVHEASEVFAGLAGSLGLFGIEEELQDQAFAVLRPRAYDETERSAGGDLNDRLSDTERAAAMLRYDLAEVGIDADVRSSPARNVEIHQRSRTGESPATLRLVVHFDSVRDCYGAVGVTHSIWRPLKGAFHDFIAMPAPDLYQALHTTVVMREGVLLEVQFLTHEMSDLIASIRSTMALNGESWSTYDPKEDRSRPHDPLVAAEAGTILELTRRHEGSQLNAEEFYELLRARLSEQSVYVYTPAGDIKVLEPGATPLDFAYAIHSALGNRYRRTLVNGKRASIDRVLVTGDKVQIVSRRRARQPNPKWLETVVSRRARREIRRALSR
jgi:GTP diphosphokinase / guanosine-3',5'-bis(diphosphate) 3'-diphosphatase